MKRDNLSVAIGHCPECDREDGMSTGGCIHCRNKGMGFNPYAIFPELYAPIEPPFIIGGKDEKVK